MKKRALKRDFYMELRKTWNRFVSILLIVVLGVAFFSGIRASEQDIRLSLDQYFDEKKLFDIRVMTSAGLTKDDLSALRQISEVKEAEPAYQQDMLYDLKGSQKVVRVQSKFENMNALTIAEGTDIQKESDCLLDTRFAEKNGLKVGDTIRLYAEKDSHCLLKQKTFTVCGICYSPQYVSFSRGNSSIGQGEVNAFLVVSKEAFDSDYFSGIDLCLKQTKKETAYTDAYQDRVEMVQNKIETDVIPTLSETALSRVKQETQKEISKQKEKYRKGKRQYESALSQYEQGVLQLEMARIYFALPEDTYQEQKNELNKAEKKLDQTKKQLVSAKKQILSAQKDIQNMEAPEWYVLTRMSLPQYDQGGENADRIGAIGKVFPVIFFLVAALISLTTMTRMVEEERIQIGTLKALGYSKRDIAAKYLKYAFWATILGSLCGVLIGEKAIPWVIVTAYQIMYPGIPNVVIPYEWKYSLLASATALLCTLGATFFACKRELASTPATLMRPVPPKDGKRILLERVSFLWNRFNFTWKSTFRNLFRYKKRLFMTVLGIGGCMGLLVFGFGLKNSISDIVDLQYQKLLHYQAMIHFEEGESRELEQYFEKQSDQIQNTCITLENLEFSTDKKEMSAALFVPEDSQELPNYVTLQNRKTKELYRLDDTGAVLTEKLAERLGVSEGDTIDMKWKEQTYSLKVNHIVENYLGHYVYLTPAYFQKIIGKKPVKNTVIFQMKQASESEIRKAGEGALSCKHVVGVSYLSAQKEQLNTMLKSLDLVMIVIVSAAGLLAFVVLYNLNNININERQRELATIKVLGFYNPELAAYVYRENILLTLLGIGFGAVFGKFLHRFIIQTVEIDSCMFSRSIAPLGYGYSVLLTLGFSILVNLVMYRKLKKIDMIASLKSVE
ncbi:MAG: FtsX-like permease family protein [Lachnospiraceae bacterium]